MAIETALAKAPLTHVERRDPYKLFHKMTPAELQALTPVFRWEAYFSASQVPDTSVINVTEPAFFKELQAEFKSRSLADWKTYLRWHLVHGQGCVLSFLGVCAGELRFLQQVSARLEGDAAALEALRAPRGSRPGRGAGPGVRPENFRRRTPSSARSP